MDERRNVYSSIVRTLGRRTGSTARSASGVLGPRDRSRTTFGTFKKTALSSNGAGSRTAAVDLGVPASAADAGTPRTQIAKECTEAGIHLLDPGTVRIGDVRFIGATLWTDLLLEGMADEVGAHMVSGGGAPP